ncbi:MAG: hypothetical protein P1U85_20710 [Verrucomicrobiales bacterium]|jgi:hypothetical protein|nr:hypothetical protein [Verrucomicrobiales bacterium]
MDNKIEGPNFPMSSDQLEAVSRKYCACQGIEPDEVITEKRTQKQMPRWKAMGMIIREHDALTVLIANERSKE